MVERYLKHFTGSYSIARSSNSEKYLKYLNNDKHSDLSNEKKIKYATHLMKTGFIIEAYEFIRVTTVEDFEGKYRKDYYYIILAYCFVTNDLRGLISTIKAIARTYKSNYKLYEIIFEYIINFEDPNAIDEFVEILKLAGIYQSYIEFVELRKLYWLKEYDQVIELYNNNRKILTVATEQFENDYYEILYNCALATGDHQLKNRSLNRIRTKNMTLAKDVSEVDSPLPIQELNSYKITKEVNKKRESTFKKSKTNIVAWIIIAIIGFFSLVGLITDSNNDDIEKIEFSVITSNQFDSLVQDLNEAALNEDFEKFKRLFVDDSNIEELHKIFSEITYDVEEIFSNTHIINLNQHSVYYKIYYLIPEYYEENSIYLNQTYNDYLVINNDLGLFELVDLNDEESSLLLESLFPEVKGHDDIAYFLDYKSLFNPKEIGMYSFDIRSIVYDEITELYEIYFNSYNDIVDVFSVSEITLNIGLDEDSINNFRSYDASIETKKGELGVYKVTITKEDFEPYSNVNSLSEIYFNVSYKYKD